MKNIKYIFILILIFIMVPAANALTADELFEKESAQYTEHLEAINEIAKEKGLPEVTLKNAGPSYYYNQSFNDTPFIENLELRNVLFYIVKNGYMGFLLNPETGKWQGGNGATTQGGFGSAVDTEEAGYGYSYPDKDGKRVYVDLSLYGMCKTAAELTDNKAVTVRYCGLDAYHRYIYVMTEDGDEYMIQYTQRPDFTGRENFKLYPFDEIYQEAKETNIKQDEAMKNSEDITGGGSSSVVDGSQPSEEAPEEQQTEQAKQPDAETAGQPEKTDTEQTDTEQEPEYQQAEDGADEKDNSLIIWIASISAVVIIGIVIVLTLTKKRK